MTERIPCVPLHEQEYWESYNDNLGLPSGTIFSSRSYKSYQDTRRQENIVVATRRVAGGSIQNDNKKT